MRRIRADLLADAIASDRTAGATAVAVVASAGTTLTGAVDDLDAVADVCEDAGVWLHVDGAYGLPAAAVRPELFAGLARADSCSVDAHKWLYLPKACGVVMSRHEDVFVEAFSHEQGYLLTSSTSCTPLTSHWRLRGQRSKRGLAFRAHGRTTPADAIARKPGRGTCCTVAPRRARTEVMDAPPQLSTVPFRHAPVGSGRRAQPTTGGGSPGRRHLPRLPDRR